MLCPVSREPAWDANYVGFVSAVAFGLLHHYRQLSSLNFFFHSKNGARGETEKSEVLRSLSLEKVLCAKLVIYSDVSFDAKIGG